MLEPRSRPVEPRRPGVAASRGPRPMALVYRPTGEIIATGRRGRGITRFEGNWYVKRALLRVRTIRPTWIPGLCPYKGLYMWVRVELPSGAILEPPATWVYWLANPLLPFLFRRLGLDGSHPDIQALDLGEHSKV